MALAAVLDAGLELSTGYQLCNFISRGSWGEVWKARTLQGEEVALKFLRCSSNQAAIQELRALQTIRQIRHPYLLPIRQIWCDGGFVVISMELADGTLLDLLEVYQDEFQTPMVGEHVCLYLEPIAAALDFLNTRHHILDGKRVAVRHCDVKPSNILLVGDTAKLSDFSLATVTTSAMWYHRRMGTLAYSAPEVFQGRLSDKTDQYALAITYCQLRSGQFPFHDTPASYDPCYIRPKPDLTMLPNAERPLIARALQPAPQDRWTSCTELLHHLSECVENS